MAGRVRSWRASILALVWVVGAGLLAGAPPAGAAVGVERVSVSDEVVETGSGGDQASIGAGGRFVAFRSSSSGLVAGDTNGADDVFVLDRQEGTTERVSVASDGTEADGPSAWPLVSADGRYVVFMSAAANLVPGDTNGIDDVFVHDRQTGATERADVASDGSEANGAPDGFPQISGDGRYVVFMSAADNLVAGDTNGEPDVFARDRQAGTTERVSVADDGSQALGFSGYPATSGDGRYMSFMSAADNLVAGDTNGAPDVFVRDRQAGTTERVSVTGGGGEADGPSWYQSVSDDGDVAFVSGAGNLVAGDANGADDVFVRDRQAGTTERVSVATDGTESDGLSAVYPPRISADGDAVAFDSVASNLVAGDTNAVADVFVRDRQAGTTERASVAGDGSEADGASWNPSITGDGEVAGFWSGASNLVAGDTNGADDVFVRDRQAGTTERVSVVSGPVESDGASSEHAVNADGRYVAFMSTADNLVAGDTNGAPDVFVRDRQAGTTERVSVATDGTEGDGSVWSPAISADGRYVAFTSTSDNLVAGDTNGAPDVFVRDRQAGTTERVSVAGDSTEGNADSEAPSLSSDGRYVMFMSAADNLVAGDTNGAPDVFVRDRQAGTTERVSVAGDGSQALGFSGYPATSADGRYVAFVSAADNLVAGDANGVPDVFVRDRQAGTTERVSVASGGGEADAFSWYPATSGDGRYVVFLSAADDLVAGDTNGAPDVFVRDRQAGTTERASVATDGSEGNADSGTAAPSISADGSRVAFVSGASNLVAGDTNGVGDVFLRDRQAGTTERVSVAGDGTQADAASTSTAISADARYVAFSSLATNLVSGDLNGSSDVFVSGPRDPAPPATDSVGVAVTGGITYSNSGSISSGNFTVTRDQRGVIRVDGYGTLPGAAGGSATVVANVNRFWIFPLYFGIVRVLDPQAGINLNTPVLFAGVVSAGTNGATSSSGWIDFSSWPWRGYRVTWTVDDLA